MSNQEHWIITLQNHLIILKISVLPKSLLRAHKLSKGISAFTNNLIIVYSAGKKSIMLQCCETLTWAYSELKKIKEGCVTDGDHLWCGPYKRDRMDLVKTIWLCFCFLGRISKCFQIPKLITPFILFYVYNQRSLK